MKQILGFLGWFVLSFAAGGALAVPVASIQDMVGDVKITTAGAAPRAAAKNDTLESGASVTTGDKSYAVLKFEDGQIIALQSNSQFQVQDYRYNPNNAQQSNIFVSLVKGGLRAITGAIATQNKAAFKLQTPQATIGIRGTDFPVVLNNGMYTQVLQGGIEVQNSAGAASLDAGQGTFVASFNALPVAVLATALPAAIFVEILAVPIAGATAAGAALGTGGAGGMSAGAMIGIGLGVAGIAAAASGGSSSTTNH
ncbi:MAG: FecR family protein [Sulfuricella denitrificans]|nr:FecR family protein [Sulfuricella denitrificans]